MQAARKQQPRASTDRAGEVIWLDAHRVTTAKRADIPHISQGRAGGQQPTDYQSRPQSAPRIPRTRKTIRIDLADAAIYAVGALALGLAAAGVI